MYTMMAFSNLATPDASSGTFEWVWFLANKYASMFLKATLVTILVAVAGTLLGFVLGFVVGVIDNAKIHPEDSPVRRVVLRIVKIVVGVYVEIFRDTPMIVQGMVIFYGLHQNDLMISSIGAGILVTVLNTGAYMGESVRGGIDSVDPGQEEGALALGMSHVGAMVYVILPQALKNIFPEMGNTFLTNLKMTSVLNVIGVTELFLMAKTAGGAYYKYYEAYLVISIIYLILCFTFNRIFIAVEKRLKQTKDYELATEYMTSD